MVSTLDKQILNDFSKSQPALQRGGYPTDDNRVRLGDLLENLMDIRAITSVTYTLQASDHNKLLTLNNAAPISVTVPSNATVPMPIGTRIDCIQHGAGKVTFVEDAGVTISSKGGNKSISSQYVAISLIKYGTDTWYLIGDLIA